ncbi:MAG: molecular chaperone DnaK [Thermoanaerobaculia bacterium]
MPKILGIDLGTTNSCAAVVDLGEPKVIPNREGSRTTPSIVAFTPDGERLVGNIAKRQMITNPANTIVGVKRLIGRKFSSQEIQSTKKYLSYEIVPAENDDIRIKTHNLLLSPEEISSYILREIKNFSETFLGEEITQAIITVPAHFNDSQRQATKDAGRIAGLEVLRIINEPTAASLAYGLDKSDVHTIAVYDLGGGTFDISILQVGSGVFEVKSTSGDTFLGGEDFDNRIVQWLLEEFYKEKKIDLTKDLMALQRLKEAAEKAKCELSYQEEVEINLPFLAMDGSTPLHLVKKLSRQFFEDLVIEIIKKTEIPIRDALDEASLRPEQIDVVLLVGGQTRTPKVQEFVSKIFNKIPSREINPDEVVAIGAAIQGGVLQGEVKDIVLLDVTPLSLGIETRGGLFTRIIERNATIPTKRSQIFTTVSDNQTVVEIHVLQGEREMAKDNKSLGRFQLVGIPAAPRGVPQIEVTFAIDASGIVQVSAKDLATGKEQSIQINPASGLSKNEIEEIIKKSEEYAREDALRREIKELQNKIEALLYTNTKVFQEFKNLLNVEERQKIEEILKDVKSKTTSNSRTTLQECLTSLKVVSQMLTSVMLYKPASGITGGPIDGS